MKDSKVCFVITPYDENSNEVYEEFIAPACDSVNYVPELARDQSTADIIDGIESSLSIAPMVIAYLGEGPNYNDNVILEIGYRFATKRPMLILVDQPDDGQKLVLPFHLGPKRVIRISLTSTKNQKLKTIKEIANQIKAKDSKPYFQSTQPVVMIQCSSDSLDGNTAFFVEASELSLKIFGSNLLNKSLNQFYSDLQTDMTASQYEAFMYDQRMLVTECKIGNNKPIIAEVPIIFKSGNYTGRAFLPIIVKSIVVGNIKEIWIMYLDVTSVSRLPKPHYRIDDLDYYPSSLNPDCVPIEAYITQSIQEQRRGGVFLVHNSIDKEQFIMPMYDMLNSINGNPWLDKEQIKPGFHWPSSIQRVIQDCYLCFIFIGKGGLGPFQKLEIPALLAEYSARGLSVIPIYLPDAPAIDDVFLRQFQAMNYSDIYNKEKLLEVINEKPV